MVPLLGASSHLLSELQGRAKHSEICGLSNIFKASVQVREGENARESKDVAMLESCESDQATGRGTQKAVSRHANVRR